jgi:hypothetical protein
LIVPTTERQPQTLKHRRVSHPIAFTFHRESKYRAPEPTEVVSVLEAGPFPTRIPHPTPLGHSAAAAVHPWQQSGPAPVDNAQHWGFRTDTHLRGSEVFTRSVSLASRAKTPVLTEPRTETLGATEPATAVMFSCLTCRAGYSQLKSSRTCTALNWIRCLNNLRNDNDCAVLEEHQCEK